MFAVRMRFRSCLAIVTVRMPRCQKPAPRIGRSMIFRVMGATLGNDIYIHIWVFPKIGVPQNGWFIMETPTKMDDLGVPLFLETPICIYIMYVST